MLRSNDANIELMRNELQVVILNCNNVFEDLDETENINSKNELFINVGTYLAYYHKMDPFFAIGNVLSKVVAGSLMYTEIVFRLVKVLSLNKINEDMQNVQF